MIIFYTYFAFFKGYEPLLILLIGWLVLIFVRAAHYANPKLGSLIGSFIASFFLPFGFITLVLNINDFIRNPPTDIKPTITLILSFILIIFAQFVLEIIMDYSSFMDKKDLNKKKVINSKKVLIPKMTGKTRYYIIKAAILSFLIISISLTLYFTFIKMDQVFALSFLSVSIAVISIYLGYCSDRRMVISTRSSYNLLFSDFNMTRLDLRKKLIKLESAKLANAPPLMIQEAFNDYLVYHSYSIWICNRYIKSFLDFEEHLSDKQKLELIHEVDNYFIDFCEGKEVLSVQLSPEYLDQLQGIVDSISTFNNFVNDEGRVQRILVNLLYLKDEGPITYQEY